MYSAAQPGQSLHKLNSWPGTYETISATAHSPRIAFVYSSLQKPTEVYLAESADKLAEARPITSFNKLFTERELPQGKPYRWKADDGTTIEGMLIYPPGKFEAKHLPMFTLIHGGPAEADGDYFEADWYKWGALAATNGWLVFEPNYRGSSGYGDKFLEQIVPVIVSRPGKDILEGVDALVKDGIADPDHLAVGGYSYGGYMTNWLITQTTRFKAAVTGAGAVEHVANWGNDDTTIDDAYFLGGRPWEAPAALSRRSRHLPDRQSPHAHAHGRRRRRHPRSRARRLSARARALFAGHSKRPADLPRRRPQPGQESLARQNQSARRIEVAAKVRRRASDELIRSEEEAEGFSVWVRLWICPLINFPAGIGKIGSFAKPSRSQINFFRSMPLKSLSSAGSARTYLAKSGL